MANIAVAVPRGFQGDLETGERPGKAVSLSPDFRTGSVQALPRSSDLGFRPEVGPCPCWEAGPIRLDLAWSQQPFFSSWEH